MKRYTYTIVFSNGVVVRNYTMKKAARYMECFDGQVTVVKAIPEGAK